MNIEALSRLGLEIRPFNLEAFTDFIGDEPGRRFFDRVVRVLPQGIKHHTLRVQVTLRPDLFNAVQFLVTGPHEQRAVFSGDPVKQLGYIALRYPERSAPVVTFDQWLEVGRPFGALHYWRHVLDIAPETQET